MLNEAELAELLGVTLGMVAIWRAERIGPPPILLAGQWHYLRPDLERWRQTFGGPDTTSSVPVSDSAHVKDGSPSAVSRAA